jgi:hypothetical protein
MTGLAAKDRHTKALNAPIHQHIDNLKFINVSSQKQTIQGLHLRKITWPNP